MIYSYVNDLGIGKFIQVEKASNDTYDFWIFNEDTGEYCGSGNVTKEKFNEFVKHYGLEGHEEKNIKMSNSDAIKMLISKLDGRTDTSYEWTECVRLAVNALEFQQKVLDRKTELYYKEGITAEENAEYYALMRLLGVEF